VSAGEVIEIAKAGKPVARLVPIAPPGGVHFGALAGRLVGPDDFDAPLPDDMLARFADPR
jgi:antitoxin (DNA-binding transcriptional repressor) of toxin-antitoxin stability system